MAGFFCALVFQCPAGHAGRFAILNPCFDSFGVSTLPSFIPGQRWISETEPELGLGIVLSVEANRVTLLFVAASLLAEAIEGWGEIHIETGVEDRFVVVHVRDTGHGIEPQHLDQLFTPFFTTKPVGAGTGLGLSISQGLVESHGGHIQVESTPGQGSRFSIHLPVAGIGRPNP